MTASFGLRQRVLQHLEDGLGNGVTLVALGPIGEAGDVPEHVAEQREAIMAGLVQVAEAAAWLVASVSSS